MNGITNAIAIIGSRHLLSCNRLLDKNGAIKNIIIIKIMFMIIEIGIMEKKSLTLFLLSSATNLESAIGRPN